MTKIIAFEALSEADLFIDAIYKGGDSHTGQITDEPINRLLGCGNVGGFRYAGSTKNFSIKFAVLYTTFQDLNWPDQLNKYSGQLTYFGDNKVSGRQLHDTKGNQVLSYCFNELHLGEREKIPPFLVFSKGMEGHDVIFLGVAVPGAPGLPSTEDLVAVWKTRSGERFQNYRAVFTILDIPVVPRSWINSINNGNSLIDACPSAWRKWVNDGIYQPLRTERIVQYRTKEEQFPDNTDDLKLLDSIGSFYKNNPFGFEKCAAEIVKMMDKSFVSYDLTRHYVDGGRDATGKFSIGNGNNSIYVDYAIEAKCYAPDNAVGVKEISRLISRIRNRQFGILVTTSYVHRQAYKEISEDGHPIIILSARDLIEILKRNGYGTENSVKLWLASLEK